MLYYNTYYITNQVPSLNWEWILLYSAAFNESIGSRGNSNGKQIIIIAISSKIDIMIMRTRSIDIAIVDSTYWYV